MALCCQSISTLVLMDVVCPHTLRIPLGQPLGLHQSHIGFCSSQGGIVEYRARKQKLGGFGIKLRTPGTDDFPTPFLHFTSYRLDQGPRRGLYEVIHGPENKNFKRSHWIHHPNPFYSGL